MQDFSDCRLPPLALIRLFLTLTFLLYAPASDAQYLAQDEEKAKALCDLGDAELVKGHLDKARGYYLEAKLRDLSNSLIMLKLAAVAEQEGNLDEAIRRAKQATEFDPNNPSVHIALAQYLEKNRDLKGTELQYERAIDATKSRQEKLPLYGKAIKCLVKLDDIEKADRLSKICLRQFPKKAESQFSRGLVLMNSSKPVDKEEALTHFAKALEIDPGLNATHYQLSILQGGLGHKELALQEIHTFIAGHPAVKELELAQEQLEKLKHDDK
jgi:tetratricopeptide (TPR) repeat protein